MSEEEGPPPPPPPRRCSRRTSALRATMKAEDLENAASSMGSEVKASSATTPTAASHEATSPPPTQPPAINVPAEPSIPRGVQVTDGVSPMPSPSTVTSREGEQAALRNGDFETAMRLRTMHDMKTIRKYTTVQAEAPRLSGETSTQPELDFAKQLQKARIENFQRVRIKLRLPKEEAMKLYAFCEKTSANAIRNLTKLLQTPKGQNIIKDEAKRFNGSIALASLDLMKRTQLKAQERATQEYIKVAKAKFGWMKRAEVTFRGSLLKQARNIKKQNNWRKRFFKLIKCAPPRHPGPYLEYYSDAGFKKRKGVVQLTENHRVQFWNGDAKKKHCFKIFLIQNPDEPDLVAEASSDGEAEHWLKAIEDCLHVFQWIKM